MVNHVTQGSYPSAVDWFQTRASGVSARYVVRSWPGQVAQCVDHANIAWHAGTRQANRRSVGIEHEGYFDDPVWFATRMYRSSARLVAHTCSWYGIPMDRRHIVGRYEASYTECLGPWWWLDYYMRLV